MIYDDLFDLVAAQPDRVMKWKDMKKTFFVKYPQYTSRSKELKGDIANVKECCLNGQLIWVDGELGDGGGCFMAVSD